MRIVKTGKNPQSNRSVRFIGSSQVVKEVSCNGVGGPNSICPSQVTTIRLLRILGDLLVTNQPYKRAHHSLVTLTE